MSITIPDSSWYRKKSTKANVPFSCPYANVHKCPRYYSSISLLGDVQMITSISADKKKEIDDIWKDSGLLPVIAEDDTSILLNGDKPSFFSNFCPEVSFKHFYYYANFLAKYADEIDKDIGQQIAKRERIKNDWRYVWSEISECHFLECSVYDQVQNYNASRIGKFEGIAHANVVALIGRLELCLENGDPSGVLQAAANILETTAKDIMKSDSIQNQTLGSFIEKYEKESTLPNELKEIVRKIYDLRSKMPLAAHGSTSVPNINMNDAIVLAATVKFIVEIEYRTRKI